MSPTAISTCRPPTSSTARSPGISLARATCVSPKSTSPRSATPSDGKKHAATPCSPTSMANCRCTRSWRSASGIDGKLGVFATQGADHTPCDQRLPGKIKRPDQPQRHAPGQDPALAGKDEQVADKEQRSEEHTSELQSLMRTSYAVFCLK